MGLVIGLLVGFVAGWMYGEEMLRREIEAMSRRMDEQWADILTRLEQARKGEK